MRYSDLVKLGFVISIALLAGCRSHELKQLEHVRDEVCACKDVACGEAALGRVPQKDIKSTPKSQAIAREMLDCLAKLYDEQKAVDAAE